MCLDEQMDHSQGQDLEENDRENSIAIFRKGGRCLIDKQTLFSPDSSLLFVISGRDILLYNIPDAQYVKALRDTEDEDRESDSIIDICLSESDDRSLISCSALGYLVTWKFHAGVQTSKIKLELPALGRISSFHMIDSKQALVVCIVKKDFQFIVLNVVSGKPIGTIQIPKLKKKNKCFVDVYRNEINPIAAIATDFPTVHIVNLKTFEVEKTYRMTANVAICCLCWHPNYDTLAVGDAMGRITLIKSCLSKQQSAKEIKHWHHLPLASIKFSTYGGLLLSGGAERVVVAWGSDDSRRFVPRLPAEILHISGSKTHLAISTADNAIQIIDSATLYTIGCIREAGGLGGKHSSSNKIGPNLQYAHPMNSLILPAGPGHLHVYSTQTDSLLYTLDITNTNIVPPERDNPHPEQIEVNLMSVGCHGGWLCTWEGRNEQERIKWWKCSPKGWSLHTVAARPHRPADPVALHMASDVPTVISVDASNVIRFWNILQSNQEKNVAWCTTGKLIAGSDKAGGAAVSPDGTVAASWCGARLQLWDTKKNIQKTCLAHPSLRPEGKLVQFGRNHHMHYIVCSTDNCLGVWNTLSLRLIWIVKLSTTCLVADPFTDSVAAITKTNDVFIFRLNSPHPIATLKKALTPQRGRITSAAFTPSSVGSTEFKLYCLREQSEIFMIETAKGEIDNSSISLERLPENAKKHSSAYSTFIAEKTTRDSKPGVPAQRSQIITKRKGALNELLLSAPCHTQSSLKNICSSVLGAISGATKVPTEVKEVEQPSTEDVTPNTGVEDKNMTSTSLKKLEREDLQWVDQIMQDDGLTIPDLEYQIDLPTCPERLSMLCFKLAVLLNVLCLFC